jgi:hypothetical protein
MAVAILLAFAMSGAVQFSYRMIDTNQGRIQERLMVQSVADLALQQQAGPPLAPDAKPVPFKITTDQVIGRSIVGTFDVTQPAPEHAVYQWAALVPRPGDVLVHVESPQMLERYGFGERYLLCNRQGGRRRPIDVTAAFPKPPAEAEPGGDSDENEG